MSSANASTAMEELEAKRAQSRVRVIGKFEAKLVLLRACSVPKNRSQDSEYTPVLEIAAVA